VVVLSRRPGRIRDVVEIAIPHDARDGAAAAADLKRLQERLWAGIKAEAQMAERELAVHA
jgi:NitT/TauT family transport system ATP-binding protein